MKEEIKEEIKKDTKIEGEKIETTNEIKTDDKEQKNYDEKYRENLTGKDLIIWYSKQIYKYIMFILAIFLFKYGTIYPFMVFLKNSPMWILYFTDIVSKFNAYHIFANLLLFSPFSSESFYWMNPFVLVYNEITFFIIGSLLYYFCCKYCIEINIIILITFLILLITKIILGIFVFSGENFNYYPAMFFQHDNSYESRGYISSNQLMKLHLFLLGMFFGNVYYCFNNKEKAKNKKYLRVSLKFSTNKFFKFLAESGRVPTFLHYIILFFAFIIYLVVVNLYEKFITDFMSDKNSPKYYTFFSDKKFNLYALFDGDLGLILFMFIILLLFFNRDNIISRILRHPFWGLIYKPYWSNLLLLHISTSFIFYFSENRIKLDFISIIFFAFQILILLTILSCLFYVLIEMPLKNLNKKILEKIEKNN